MKNTWNKENNANYKSWCLCVVDVALSVKYFHREDTFEWEAEIIDDIEGSTTIGMGVCNSAKQGKRKALKCAKKYFRHTLKRLENL